MEHLKHGHLVLTVFFLREIRNNNSAVQMARVTDFTCLCMGKERAIIITASSGKQAEKKAVKIRSNFVYLLESV